MVPIFDHHHTFAFPFHFFLKHSIYRLLPIHLVLFKTYHITTRATMANYPTKPSIIFLFFCLIWAALVLQGVAGSRTLALLPNQVSTPERELHLEDRSNCGRMKRDSRRRSMIGSVMPTCTYNECRGCKYRCRAEQVPVEGNDPINSAYHYRCVCHSPRTASCS